MITTKFESLSEMKNFLGKEIGVSDWFQITQKQINAFGKVTFDEQWIHTNPEKAKKNSPYGEPIAHGFLILSLIPKFLTETISFANVKMGINYGMDKVRFMNATPVNARIRARITLAEVSEISGGVKYKTEVVLELENVEKPACYAEMIAIMLVE
ncbi:MaoC family dehydratase [Portibacter lacus]|uniref:MaoC family dehydratase n=1 Tax=Portibacter lacus TaxID=1099794 RepID=A0AA37WDV3_9BACT|nr:MaoC family dehydratase [Portibacter lacus]GLR16049.1 MaoC family dehydratase [Portibacter lacus]